MNTIHICFSPALYPYYPEENSIVVIVDIFRASTSICTAFYNGVKSIKTVATVEEAMQMKSQGYLVAAERNVKRCDFADFGNSPFDFTSEKVKGEHIIFTTTNGTQAVECALNADEILIGAFSNIQALTDYCVKSDKNILILCSGWNNRFCVEDTLFSGGFAEKLLHYKDYNIQSDAVKTALELWKFAKTDLYHYICRSEHFERLKKNGLDDSVAYCLTENKAPVVPKYNKKDALFII